MVRAHTLNYSSDTPLGGNDNKGHQKSTCCSGPEAKVIDSGQPPVQTNYCWNHRQVSVNRQLDHTAILAQNGESEVSDY